MTATPVVIASKHRAAAVVLAAGSGARMGAIHNKVFLHLCGRRVVSWSIETLARVPAVKRLVLVIREEDRAVALSTIDREIDNVSVEVVVGGATRQQSELSALRHLAPAISAGEINVVMVHDGARPILSPRLISTLIRTAVDHKAVFPALVADDIRHLRADGTIDMTNAPPMLRAQTPQAFEAATLLQAYEQAAADNFDGSDTVSCWQHYHTAPVRWVPGDPRNIKITYPEDLFEAEIILRDANFQVE